MIVFSVGSCRHLKGVTYTWDSWCTHLSMSSLSLKSCLFQIYSWVYAHLAFRSWCEKVYSDSDELACYNVIYRYHKFWSKRTPKFFRSSFLNIGWWDIMKIHVMTRHIMINDIVLSHKIVKYHQKGHQISLYVTKYHHAKLKDFGGFWAHLCLCAVGIIHLSACPSICDLTEIQTRK